MHKIFLPTFTHDMASSRLPEVKNNRKIQNISPKTGRLQKVVAYKTLPLYDFTKKVFGILEKWSLMEGGRLQELVAQGGWTVYSIRICSSSLQPLCRIK